MTGADYTAWRRIADRTRAVIDQLRRLVEQHKPPSVSHLAEVDRLLADVGELSERLQEQHLQAPK